MGKYYTAIGIFSIFIISVFIAGVIVVNPSSKRDSIMDKNRLDDFIKIKYQIESYYRDNGKLPSSLEEISDANIKDPQTQKVYAYKLDSQYSYNLCTTFSTDESKKSASSYRDVTSDMYLIHKKGYDCLSFKLSDYVLNTIRTVTPIIYNRPTQSALSVNSIPAGITMSSDIPGFDGVTNYVKTKVGILSARIDAPTTTVVNGIAYTFRSWTGCNNDTFVDQYCTVLVNGNTLNITAVYVSSFSTPTPQLSN